LTPINAIRFPHAPLFPKWRLEARMLDLLYLAIGIGVFVLFGAYALGLRRI
jgi:hypothetical protein